MENKPVLVPPEGQLLIYQDGSLRVQVRLDGETVWLTQRLMAELYQVSVKTINEHLLNIYEEGELEPEATVRKFRRVQTEGSRQVSRVVDHYNLEAILAVGYRVRSSRGAAFRQWATARLSELLVKGFTLDDDRLKEGRTLGDHYFEELLERIRDIRASERLFYQKITDIYATSIDYDPKAEIAQTFFATVQNKLHWAIHGHTAAEIIYQRSDANKLHMGLATWRNAPHGPIRKADVTVAKNYLSEEEIRELNRVVTMYLDYAEDMARRHKPMYMADWVKKLDAFLQFNERNILTHAGRISHQVAEERALEEFGKYDKERRRLEAVQPASDFDRFLEETRQLAGGKIKEPPEKDKALRKTTREKK
ncbi:virulence RhuM family protein [Aminiphilus circumscriptus]|uniref:virulence RhuM family protein n=1 Tax=Aminiphilus circumscriptus TaxID=290732 RepID=UPI0004786046|nr:virulence RhuM family protein [Aminiphilus circumscriptus]